MKKGMPVRSSGSAEKGKGSQHEVAPAEGAEGQDPVQDAGSRGGEQS